MAINGDELLEQHRIEDVPESMYYIPNFITTSEEAYILDHVSSSTGWQQVGRDEC